MIILQCRRCGGTGEITNEQFRICQELSPETKRYFHIQTEDVLEEEDVRQHDACRNISEKIPCPNCDGVGIIAFDEDDWDLRIVADEEEALGE
jgi:RecJ-like exonuclease